VYKCNKSNHLIQNPSICNAHPLHVTVSYYLMSPIFWHTITPYSPLKVKTFRRNIPPQVRRISQARNQHETSSNPLLVSILKGIFIKHNAEFYKDLAMVYNNTWDYWGFFWFFCPSSGILKNTQTNTTFRKLDLFSSSDAGVADTYPVTSVRKSFLLQSLDNLCQYNNSYINTWAQVLSTLCSLECRTMNTVITRM
jgi:hypothetical protein